MSDLLTAPRGELLKLVYELIEENQALKAQNAELRARIDELSQGPKDKTKTPPSWVKPNVKKSKEKKARQKRDGGHARKLETPTRQEFHSFDVCPDCGGPLGKPSVAYTRQVVDIPQTEFTVTEHIIFKRWCFACKKRVAPKVNLGNITLGSHRLGLNTLAVIATLRERLRLPVRSIKGYLATFHHLRLSEGQIMEILHQAASLGRPTHDRILGEVKSSSFICGDETGFRQDGINGYLWTFTTPSAQIMLYRKSRGSVVVKEIVGQDGHDYEGVIVSDFYGAYNQHLGFHQRCWAHLLRDIHDLKKEYPRHPPLNRWAKKIHDLYREAQDYSGPETRLPVGLQAEERLRKEQYFKDRLKAICAPYLIRETPVSGLSGRMIKFLPELFTFVRFPGIPSTNNLAERSLRHAVVQRKIFGGTRSEKGSQTKAILGSLFGTWNLQNKDPLQEMRLLLARAPCQ